MTVTTRSRVHRLPPVGRARLRVRQLAGDLRLAPGTVARANSELESDGLLISTRAVTRVRAVTPLPAAARAAARDYIAALGGLTLADAIRAVRVEWTDPAV